jgi:hypothetical protein
MQVIGRRNIRDTAAGQLSARDLSSNVQERTRRAPGAVGGTRRLAGRGAAVVGDGSAQRLRGDGGRGGRETQAAQGGQHFGFCDDDGGCCCCGVCQVRGCVGRKLQLQSAQLR